MKHKSIEDIYLDIIYEWGKERDNWEKCASYRGVDFYIRKDGHLRRRLKERYEGKLTLAKVIDIMKRYVKEELNDPNSKLAKKNPKEYPFTVYAELANAYISGRANQVSGGWNLDIATALPALDTHHSRNDEFKIVKA